MKILAGAALVLVFAAAGCGGPSSTGANRSVRATGSTAANSPTGATSPTGANGLATARFPSYGLSLRYRTSWARIDWCWDHHYVIPITFLTTTHPGPRCDAHTPNDPWPPETQLAANGVAVGVSDNAIPGGGTISGGNTRFRGRLAYLSKPSYVWKKNYVFSPATCPTASRSEYRYFWVQEPPPRTGEIIEVDAVICGPDLAAGQASLRHLLASIRLSGLG